METKKKYRPSQFNTCIKIKKVQYDWIKKNKDCKTMAGYLDKIINNYKTHGHRK